MTKHVAHNRSDYAGAVVGNLTVDRPHGKDKFRNIVWLCRCSCGARVYVRSGDLARAKRLKLPIACAPCGHRAAGLRREAARREKSTAARAPTTIGSLAGPRGRNMGFGRAARRA